MLHQNKISKLPFQIKKIWNNIQSFSIDWFSYILPVVGKILKVKSETYEDD
jgi:hypothetical protein